MNHNRMFKYLVLAVAMVVSLMLGACEPEVVEVERVVTEVVMETVIIEGTPEVVEKEVTRVITEVEEVEKEVTRVVEVESETAEEDEPSGPIYGGTLRFAAGSNITDWNPYRVIGCTPETFFAQIYSGLLRYDKDSKLVGDLAESWEWTDDTTVVFRLRENVQWHNGDPLVADHVVKSQEWRLDPEMSTNADFLNGIVDGWEALDDYTVQLTLQEPNSGILRYMTGVPGFGFILHPDFDPATSGQSFETNIGTGPFMYGYFEPDVRMTLAKNPNYYIEGLPYLDAIDILMIPDSEARTTGLRAGDLDIISYVDFQSVPMIQELDEIYMPEGKGFYGGRQLINALTPPMDDVNVRHALNYAVDRQMIADVIFAGEAEALYGSIMPEGRFGYVADYADYYSYDPAKATELLAEAGWTDTDGDGTVDKDGEPMVLQFLTYGPSYWSQQAEVMQANFRAIGVECELDVRPWADFASERQRNMDLPADEPSDFHIIGSTLWGLDMSDYSKLVNDGIYDFNRYFNDEVGTLMDQAYATTDDAEREALFIEAQKLVVEDAPWIANNWISRTEAARSWVRNFHHANDTGCYGILMWEAWLAR